MVSPESVQLRSFLLSRKNASPPATIDEARARLEAMASQTQIPSNTQVEEVVGTEVVGEWLTLQETAPERVILHLHGGAYVMGSCNTERELASRLCAASKARVLLIEYRLAPEHPFPAALDDAIAAYRWLINRGINSEHIAISGVSSGGGVNAQIVSRND